MNKLLLAETKRIVLSPLFYLAIFIIVGINAFEIVACNYGFQVSLTTFLFTHTKILCIIMSILIPLHIGQEFEHRTINNKIVAGYKRLQFYLSEVVVSLICTFILLSIDCLCVFGFCFIQQYNSNSIDIVSTFISFIITLSSLCTISILYTAIIIILRQRIVSITFTLLLSLCLLHAGTLSVSSLIQPPYQAELTSNNKKEELIPNPLYLSGNKRVLTNLHISISPFAQLSYIPFISTESRDTKKENSLIFQNYPYHIEYCIINIIEILCILYIGFYIFKQHDLK